MEETMARRLVWDACYNVRDLGGHRTVDERETRWRAVVRADNLSRLTPAGWADLCAYGIRTIIDLRSPRELTVESCPFVRGDGSPQVTYLNLPVFTSEQIDAAPQGVPIEDDYLWMLSNLQSEFGAIVTAVARAAEGGVLFHCHSGKDRTGLVAALLLALVDVPREAIAADYALSMGYLQPALEEWLRNGPGERAAREEQAKGFTSRPETMLATLEALESRYGIAEAYLLEAGVPAEDIRRLRERLLLPST